LSGIHYVYLPILKLLSEFYSNVADKRWEYKVVPIQHEVFSHHPGRKDEMHGAKYVKDNIVPDVHIHFQIKYPNIIRGNIPTIS
jgi:hypothetical protein